MYDRSTVRGRPSGYWESRWFGPLRLPPPTVRPVSVPSTPSFGAFWPAGREIGVIAPAPESRAWNE